ncbi:MAG: GDP-mannose 4,6-dehydratase [Parvibaculum sp.]|nr:GDP-mannose 4,6-dehydratase [Parvibaculum sp.]
MPCSLVLGVNGQDGSYLAEALLRRGHQVVGVGRNTASRYIVPSSQFRYVDLDLRDGAALGRLASEVAPDFAFHFAAVHGSAGFQYEPVVGDMFATNVVALHVLLEHARLSSKPVRVVYAGSSKIFPNPLEGVIDETTPARATCLYSIGKIAARDLIMQYRALHKVAATNLILFNHESSRRPLQFLLPTIANGILRAKTDPAFRLKVQTLDFRIDWAAADEFADLSVEIATRTDVDEFVLASGVTHHARAIVHGLFQQYGLDGETCIIEALARRDPGPEFRVSLERLEKAVGRKPVKSVPDIVADMVSAADASLSRGVA